jgi:hypothetical protein
MNVGGLHVSNDLEWRKGFSGILPGKFSDNGNNVTGAWHYPDGDYEAIITSIK